MAVICISRQFGAGGITLGGMLAQGLGYEFISEKRILEMVAEKGNLSLEMVEGVEKEAGGRLMRLLALLVPSSFMDRHLGEGKTDLHEAKYVQMMTSIFLDLAEQNDKVLVGWGNQFILKEHPNALRVLLVADRPSRIRFMMDNYGLDSQKAEQLVAREEKRRERFMENFGSVNPDNPNLYHLVINTTHLKMDAAWRLVMELVGSHVDHTARPIWD